MMFFFDNNISEFIVRGLRGFGEDVCHLKEHFQVDARDEDWLEFVGKEGMFLITRDQRIRKRPLELDALRRYRVGAFFLSGKDMSRWDQINQIIRAWPKIKESASRVTPPFAFRVVRAGTTVEKLPLD